MGNNSRFDDAYNAQISVDADLQIIGAQHISQSANDKQEIEPTLKAIQGTAGRLPDQLSADNGYFSGDNLQALELSSTDTYITTDKGEKSHKKALEGSERNVVKADFTYQEATTHLPILKVRS